MGLPKKGFAHKANGDVYRGKAQSGKNGLPNEKDSPSNHNRCGCASPNEKNRTPTAGDEDVNLGVPTYRSLNYRE
ncbi:hypothetical protein QO002_005140 [Pararhizobium capsulatum DSM 1112]|uniref:Uncharacterized protein n=1 Tax=Pararhizobium capsulatum DSM 1112 TaxID=1121113 RepID=A0ABU0BXE0_9HYPH|nr:hypothetical protein [Pararhizobium capsulatum DSM 1112]